MRSRAGRIALALLVVAVAGTACSRPPRIARPSPTETDGAAPAIKITAPRAGESVRAGDLVVSFVVRGIALASPAAAQGPDGPHVDVFLDGEIGAFVNGDVPVPAGTDRIVHASGPTVTFRDVGPGPHTIAVLLVSGTHLAVRPRVWDSVSVLAH